jgi:hypothetical protein
MKVFEYVVVLNPEVVEGKQAEKSKIVVPPTTMLAKDDFREALLMAARAIPEDYVHRIAELDIAIRPF